MMRNKLFAVLAALLVAACAGFGGPNTVVLGEQELAALLAREFPRQQRLLEVFDVTVTAPRVRLLPERNRIATDLEFTAADRFSGRPVRGSLALDYALRFEPSDATVRLAQVRVDRVNLETGSSVLPLPAQRIGGLLAERLLDESVIWRARPEQAQRIRALGLNAGAVNVTARGVEITLAPGFTFK
jgi:hypothetical protein